MWHAADIGSASCECAGFGWIHVSKHCATASSTLVAGCKYGTTPQVVGLEMVLFIFLVSSVMWLLYHSLCALSIFNLVVLLIRR